MCGKGLRSHRKHCYKKLTIFYLTNNLGYVFFLNLAKKMYDLLMYLMSKNKRKVILLQSVVYKALFAHSFASPITGITIKKNRY